MTCCSVLQTTARGSRDLKPRFPRPRQTMVGGQEMSPLCNKSELWTTIKPLKDFLSNPFFDIEGCHSITLYQLYNQVTARDTKIISLDCGGLNSKIKLKRIQNTLVKLRCDIQFLQQMHVKSMTKYILVQNGLLNDIMLKVLWSCAGLHFWFPKTAGVFLTLLSLIHEGGLFSRLALWKTCKWFLPQFMLQTRTNIHSFRRYWPILNWIFKNNNNSSNDCRNA